MRFSCANAAPTETSQPKIGGKLNPDKFQQSEAWNQTCRIKIPSGSHEELTVEYWSFLTLRIVMFIWIEQVCFICVAADWDQRRSKQRCLVWISADVGSRNGPSTCEVKPSPISLEREHVCRSARWNGGIEMKEKILPAVKTSQDRPSSSSSGVNWVIDTLALHTLLQG